MEWMLSVTDHIVELVPSWQRYPDGSRMEVWNPQKIHCPLFLKISNLAHNMYLLIRMFYATHTKQSAYSSKGECNYTLF